MSSKATPFYQDVDGFRIPGVFCIDTYLSALAYEAREDDLFVVTYPKCGTTWVQHIIASIFRQGEPFRSALEFLTQTPFLELAGAKAALTMKRPGAIKIHLPFRLTPYNPDAKYIFVARNPKDCVVSFFHHTRNLPGYKYGEGNFGDYFELFIRGEVDFGDYFDTLMSWYEHRDDPNVLFLTYEQLKEDTRKCILEIAGFMGSDYKVQLEQDPDFLDRVFKHSSFGYMNEAVNRLMTDMVNIPKEEIENDPDIPEGVKKMLTSDILTCSRNPSEVHFVRKGIVGDWRNQLTVSQNDRLDAKFRERTKGTDIPKLWEKYM